MLLTVEIKCNDCNTVWSEPFHDLLIHSDEFSEQNTVARYFCPTCQHWKKEEL